MEGLLYVGTSSVMNQYGDRISPQSNDIKGFSCDGNTAQVRRDNRSMPLFKISMRICDRYIRRSHWMARRDDRAFPSALFDRPQAEGTSGRHNPNAAAHRLRDFPGQSS